MTETTSPAIVSQGSESAPFTAKLPRQLRLLEAYLSSISDFVYAFDRTRRFVYANPAMLALFGLSWDEMIGNTFVDLNYPTDLANLLNGHIDRIFAEGVTVEDEVFYDTPSGHAAYFSYRWGPVRGEDGTIEQVIGVSRDTSERRAFEDALQKSEARLRAATELVGLGIYAWDPMTGALEWDARLREMWGLPADATVNTQVYEAGIHPRDLPRVHAAIAACVDPAGDGRYSIEYRVIGRDDGVTRHIATSGQTTFSDGQPAGFVGAAIDMTARRNTEAAIRASEAQFRSFAAHSSNLIWIGDPVANTIIYRSAAFERIWGTPCAEGPTDLGEWMKNVHPDDRSQVEHALASVKAGEVVQFEYRIARPADGSTRWLRDTSFPIPDDAGAITRIGGVTEDLTREDVRQAYIVGAQASAVRKLAGFVRGLGYRVRTFDDASAILDIAPVLSPGCVLVDVRMSKADGLAIPRELKARSITLPTIVLDAPAMDAAAGVAAMKAGAVDYVAVTDDAAFHAALEIAMTECHGPTRPPTRDENAGARVARLSSREREVLVGLVEGGTNKVIGQKLGISPRTVELHRAQVMNRVNARTLSELLQIAMAAGIVPATQSGPASY
ncbi:PAS domain-containing protein [Sphingomonas yunnanensis]|uniref:PAS domain-containing protein n=1 Tax=Sphingomonas yunnanensis TaxID=310400 RepID=UPI001CA6857E|nr:PAS domain-containing protein [Sphingomonas yunnanensis]MBY9062619.1 PAS domain-containing protein [Sphingomonas yunnanensis]